MEKFKSSSDNLESFSNFLVEQHNSLRNHRIKTSLRDFKILSQIGQGAFGEIHLARHISSRKVYALKVIQKKFNYSLDQKVSVLTERDILAIGANERLVQVKYAFQDTENLYFAMEYMSGGDFRTFINDHLPPSYCSFIVDGNNKQTGFQISEDSLFMDMICFYFKEMVEAVAALHDMGYMHRDIKPENFLISNTGHVKLGDFGLACGILSSQYVDSQAAKCIAENQDASLVSSETNNYSGKLSNNAYNNNEHKSLHSSKRVIEHNSILAFDTVGSTDYMAIEVVQGKQYKKSVDFWSLGCVLFEMIFGKTPFQGSREAILNWNKTLQQKPIVSVTQRVLCGTDDDATRRFGGGYSKQTRPHSTMERQQNFHQNVDHYHSKINKQVINVLRPLDDVTWSLIKRLITDSASRYQSAHDILKDRFFIEHKYLGQYSNSKLYESTPPFVPAIESEIDIKYFDDFESPEIHEMYNDIFKQRRNVELRYALKELEEKARNKKNLVNRGNNSYEAQNEQAIALLEELKKKRFMLFTYKEKDLKLS